MKKVILLLAIFLSVASCFPDKIEENIPEVITGIDGVDGQDGLDGSDGVDGSDGSDGSDGQDGSDGTDGANCFDNLTDLNGDGNVDIYDCQWQENPTSTTVTDTNRCGNNIQYVIYLKERLSNGSLKNRHYTNISLHFIEYSDKGTALLCGKVEDIYSGLKWNVNILFSELVGEYENAKDPWCIEDFDKDDWKYYNNFQGTMKSVDGKHSLNLSRYGSPFQIGTDANPTNSEKGSYGGAGWLNTNGDPCFIQGDINIIIKDI